MNFVSGKMSKFMDTKNCFHCGNEIIKKDEYIPKELVTLYTDNKDVFYQNIGNNKVPEFLPKCFENH